MNPKARIYGFEPLRHLFQRYDGLVATVWNLITETNGAPEAVWAAGREHIRTDPGMLLAAWAELTDLWNCARGPSSGGR